MDEKPIDANGAESSNAQVDGEAKAQTQADEQSAASGTSDNNIPFHEHPRFKELVEDKNRARAESDALRQEVEALKNRLGGNNDATSAKSAKARRTEFLIGKGLSREDAINYVDSEAELVQDEVQRNIGPIMENQKSISVGMAIERFKKEHPDYDKYENAMSDVLKTLNKDIGAAFAANPEQGLQFLYNHVKSKDIEEVEKSSLEKGRQEAYEKKQEKSSISSSPSSKSSPSNSLYEELEKIDDPEEYAKVKKEMDKKEAKLLGVIYRG